MMASNLIEALNQLSAVIAFGASIEDMLKIALKHISAYMQADLGTIQLLDDNNCFHTVCVEGLVTQAVYDSLREFDIHDSGIQALLTTDHAHVVKDFTETLPMGAHLAQVFRDVHYGDSVVIALKAKDEIIGALSVGYKAPNIPPVEQIKWFEAMANLLSVGIYNRQLLTDLHTKQAALQDAWKAVTDAQEKERSRLSRELHDEVGQALTSLMLRMKALQTETDIETVVDRINGLRYLTGKTLEEVRRISTDLHPVVFDELGLVPAIRAYVNDRSTLAKIDVEFRIIGDVYLLLPELEIACYRAVQEGLTNIIRHAHADQASITLTYGEKSVRLVIKDNGVGLPDPDKIHGLGLLGIRERALLVGGTIEIVSSPGDGVALIIDFPRIEP